MFNIKDSGFNDESTNVPLSEKTKDKDIQSRFSNQIIKAELKQLEFLRHKCTNLKDTISSLKNQNNLLKKQNNRLLLLNTEYLNNVNVFYQEKFDKIQKIIFPNQLTTSKSELESATKDYLRRNSEGFKKLQNDHRRLIKHCAVIQKENGNLKNSYDQLRRIKEELLSVNHTDVTKLVKEMKQTQDQNQRIRANNNQLVYQTEKLILDINKMSSQFKDMEKEYQRGKKQMNENRALINKFSQQAVQKQNIHQRALYQLQVKCDQLEKQLRVDQVQVNRVLEQSEIHQAQKVEFVQKQQSMMKSMREMASLLYLSNNGNPLIDNRLSSVSIIESKRQPRRGRISKSFSVAR